MVEETSKGQLLSKNECLFHSRKHITYLFKNFLNLLEDIKFNHDNNYEKLAACLNEEQKDILELSNFLDQQSFQHYRKRILDHGNSAIRNLEKDIEII